MLWALLFGYLFYSAGSSSTDPAAISASDIKVTGEQLMQVVAGTEREAAVNAVLAELDAGYKKFGKSYIKSAKVFAKQYKDHSATAEDAYVVLDVLNDEWQVAQTRSTDLHFELKDLLTEREWNSVFSSEVE
jgi:hypothetical protein